MIGTASTPHGGRSGSASMLVCIKMVGRRMKEFLRITAERLASFVMAKRERKRERERG